MVGSSRKAQRRKAMRIVFIILAALYCGLPTDLIPDFIPVAGQIDDIIVVLLALFSGE